MGSNPGSGSLISARPGETNLYLHQGISDLEPFRDIEKGIEVKIKVKLSRTFLPLSKKYTAMNKKKFFFSFLSSTLNESFFFRNPPPLPPFYFFLYITKANYYFFSVSFIISTPGEFLIVEQSFLSFIDFLHTYARTQFLYYFYSGW